jgi:hypothetical protein
VDKWWEVAVNDAGNSGLVVRVAKVGGGTPGRSYVGEWEFEVLNSAGEVIQKSYLTTGMSKTHVEACQIVLDYYSQED